MNSTEARSQPPRLQTNNKKRCTAHSRHVDSCLKGKALSCIQTRYGSLRYPHFGVPNTAKIVLVFFTIDRRNQGTYFSSFRQFIRVLRKGLDALASSSMASGMVLCCYRTSSCQPPIRLLSWGGFRGHLRHRSWWVGR